ncbi:hypothetical protein K7X08_016193 [Anisodus acutangulus]|uniref:non-specific serine/threonine protein kinase n=1 Tax=Anisodus acutangulus TaxID=402998 RepID=A0A9Q1LDA8_9SOLA|nr:hypothetical protein K7X08_016193 [Anisodus acutangulus]
MDWSEGCALSKPFSCQSKDVFVKFSELKLPDTTKSWDPIQKSLNDILPTSTFLVSEIVLGQDNWTTEGPKEDMDLPFFDLATIVNATDNFSFNNKLGEEGFGLVYKGTLVDGREIDVKRLSKSSGQGLNEFKNEVKLIAKLQHQNLVKLVGSCIDGEEKMLIYEYMANGNLDSFVFGLYPFSTEWEFLLENWNNLTLNCQIKQGGNNWAGQSSSRSSVELHVVFSTFTRIQDCELSTEKESK